MTELDPAPGTLRPYRCHTYETWDDWTTVYATTLMEAALIFAGYPKEPPEFVFVLRPGEMAKVDKATKIDIQKAKQTDYCHS